MEKQVKSHELFAHVKLYQKRPKHPWACATCKVVIDKSKHVQHRQSKHPELKDGWTHCKHCQLVFRCDAQLKDHLDENSRCNSQYNLMKINTKGFGGLAGWLAGRRPASQTVSHRQLTFFSLMMSHH